MESIKELRKICQQSNHNKPMYKLEGLWRFFSVYITKLILYTPITANQVTMFMILCGFISAFFLSQGYYVDMIVGAVILEIIYLLDAVDGEIARYKKMQSTEGVFLDLIMHLASITIPFMGITIGLYRINPGIGLVISGLSASVFSVFDFDIQALKHQAIFMKLVKTAKESNIIIKKIKKIEKNQEEKKSNPKTIFNTYINPFYENYLIMQIITLAAILDNLYWVLVFYGITFPIIWFIKLIYEYRLGYDGYEYLLKPYKK